MDDPDAAFAAIAEELDGFSSDGLTVAIAARQEMGLGSLKLAGAIYDESGHRVGTFSRDLLVIGSRRRAFHMVFELEPQVRGRAFREAFFRHAEAVYRSYGIDDIRVSAEQIGSYLWAKEDFVFMGDKHGQRQAEVELWMSRGRSCAEAAVARGDLPEAVMMEIDALFAEIAAGGREPLEPRDLARLAYQHTWTSDGHTVWLGKEMLIDWAWNGIKTL